jgi:hypothetical protein
MLKEKVGKQEGGVAWSGRTLPAEMRRDNPFYQNFRA